MKNTPQFFKKDQPTNPIKETSNIENIEEKTKTADEEGTTCGGSVKNSVYSFFANIQYGCERVIAAFANYPQGADAHFTPGGTLG